MQADRRQFLHLLRGGFATGAVGLLAACSQQMPKHLEPLSYRLQTRMRVRGMTGDDPVMLRLFKQESELEVWKQTDTGSYGLLSSYDICRWSGILGPKLAEGDRQAPEGFYMVNEGLMNPWSNYYLSFNMGFPNTFDRSYDRTGSFLMIHGACSSAGCYSMTDETIRDVYSLARDAFIGGQEAFQIQAFPFRMNDDNMEQYRDHPDIEFWRNIKGGYDAFNETGLPPKVSVCNRTYVFNTEFDTPDGRLDSRQACPEGRPMNIASRNEPVIGQTQPVQNQPVPQYPPANPASGQQS
jgi:murein L,D-transpeptidase YafK